MGDGTVLMGGVLGWGGVGWGWGGICDLNLFGSEWCQIVGCFGNVDNNYATKEVWTSRLASVLFKGQEKT